MADHPTKILLFGCGEDAGHFLHRPSAGRPVTDYGVMRRLPALVSGNLDGVFPPQRHRKEFVPRRVVLEIGADTWTVLAWWDYSVDNRGGSNTALIWKGRHTNDEMIQAAAEAFPWAIERIQAVQDYLSKGNQTED